MVAQGGHLHSCRGGDRQGILPLEAGPPVEWYEGSTSVEHSSLRQVSVPHHLRGEAGYWICTKNSAFSVRAMMEKTYTDIPE